MKVKFPDGTELALASLPRRTSLWMSGAKRWKMEFPFPEADLDAVYAHMAGGDLQTLDNGGAVLNTYERYTLSPEVLVKNGQATLALVQDDFAEVQEAQAEAQAAAEAKAQAEAQAAAANTALAYVVGESQAPGEGAAADKATAFRTGLGSLLAAAQVQGEAALVFPEAFEWWQTGKVYPANTPLRYTYTQWGTLLVETIREVDTATHPDWTPEAAPSEYKAWHGKSKETAQPYLMRDAQDVYMAGERCIFQGHYWSCKADNTTWSPEEYPQNWQDEGAVA